MLYIFVDLLVLRVEKLKTKRQLKYFFGTLRPTLKYIYYSLLITFLSHVTLLKFFPGSWRFFSHANINYTADITSQAFIISYKYRFFSGKKGSGGLFLVSRWHYLVFLEVKKYDMKEFVTVMIEETLLLLFVK